MISNGYSLKVLNELLKVGVRLGVVIVKRLSSLILASVMLAGCAGLSQQDEVPSAISNSPDMQSDSQDGQEAGGLTEEEKQELYAKVSEAEAEAKKVQENTDNAFDRNDAEKEARLGGLIWPAGIYPPYCNIENYEPTTSIQELDVCGTFLTAWSEIWALMDSNRNVDPQFDAIISPATSGTEELDAQVALIDQASRLWGANFWPEDKARIIFLNSGSESEETWFVETVDELGGLPYMFSDNGRSWYQGSTDNYECGALASQGGGYYTMVLCIGWDLPSNLKITPHEYTHWYHGQFGELTEKGPLWFIEGAAEFYGIAIGMKGQERAVPYRFYLYEGHSAGFGYRNKTESLLNTLASISEEDFVSLMRFHEDKWKGDPQFSYLVGGMATEALVAVYGANKVDEFAKSFEVTSGWKQSFEEVFGIEVADFYRHLHAYTSATATSMLGSE